MASRRDELVGNRFALVGAALYFMEWVVIPFIPSLPLDKLGDGQAAIAAAYANDPWKTGFAAGWFGFVLLGRVAFCAGLRNGFRTSPRELPLADWAFGAMVLSVGFEVIEYGLVAGGAWLAHGGADPGTIVALNAAAIGIGHLVFVTLGVSVFAGSLAMLMSRMFPSWISWLGVFAGGLLVSGAILSSATVGTSGSAHDIGGVIEGLPVLGFWIWIIATSVVLFRHTPRREAAVA